MAEDDGAALPKDSELLDQIAVVKIAMFRLEEMASSVEYPQRCALYRARIAFTDAAQDLIDVRKWRGQTPPESSG